MAVPASRRSSASATRAYIGALFAVLVWGASFIATKIRRWLPQIGHFQIAGVPGRHEPDTGEVNYAWIFRLLGDLGYDGWIGCEYRPAQGTAAGLGWLYRLIDRARVAAPGDDD